AAFQYSVTEGVPELREWVANRMRSRYQTNVVAENVTITGGSQQGLDLFARVLIDAGDTIVVENPTYLGALQAFEACEPSYLTVDTDEHGIIPEALERALAAAKTPPKVVEICERFGLPILEDDPYGEITFEDRILPPLISYAKTGSVAYLGTG